MYHGWLLISDHTCLAYLLEWKQCSAGLVNQSWWTSVTSRCWKKLSPLKSLQRLTYAHFSVTLSTAFPLPVPTEKVRSVQITTEAANDFFGIWTSHRSQLNEVLLFLSGSRVGFPEQQEALLQYPCMSLSNRYTVSQGPKPKWEQVHLVSLQVHCLLELWSRQTSSPSTRDLVSTAHAFFSSGCQCDESFYLTELTAKLNYCSELFHVLRS